MGKGKKSEGSSFQTAKTLSHRLPPAFSQSCADSYSLASALPPTIQKGFRAL